MNHEKFSERVARLIQEAVRNGWVRNQTHALSEASLTSGWLRELQGRESRYYAAANPAGEPPTMRGDKAAALAEVLRVSVDELLGGPPAASASEAARRKATDAARLLDLPAAAISQIENRPLVPGLSELDWFREIEIAAGDLPTASSPRELAELPRNTQRRS